MDVHNITIESDGTVAGTIIKINGESIAGVQEFTFQVKADPLSTIHADMRIWKRVGTEIPLPLTELKDGLSSVYGAYVTPFTGQLELSYDTLHFVPE